MRRPAAALLILALLSASPAGAADKAYDAEAWRADLAQVRQTLTTRYANLEWVQGPGEADLGRMFESGDRLLGTYTDDAQARRMFDDLGKALADGHLRFDWPAAPAPVPAPAATPSPAPSPCTEIVYRKRPPGPPLLAEAPGWTPLDTPRSAVFPAGLLDVDGRRVGVIRIGEFGAAIAPQYCDEAVAKGVTEGLYDAVYGRLTREFAAQLRALKAAGAQALLIDITGNGGGTDWAEALVRMVTAKRLTSTRVDVVRGDHWVANFDRDLAQLQETLKTLRGADKALVADLIAQLKARRAEASKPCDAAPLLEGRDPGCSPLTRGFYSSGLLASADPAAFAGKDWAGLVFNPFYYPFEEGVWSGPLLVAVDGKTASAAEQFTAVLQDNDAAVIVGDPTRGAGCGYTWGGTPVTLKNSGGVLRLPDCARIRRDGENEVIGISPDVLAGFHDGDGRGLKARRLLAALPRALDRAGVR